MNEMNRTTHLILVHYPQCIELFFTEFPFKHIQTFILFEGNQLGKSRILRKVDRFSFHFRCCPVFVAVEDFDGGGGCGAFFVMEER